jgi:predicted regulator of Ras-like GTPase activity (Roadblock/LC7/MglB family)
MSTEIETMIDELINTEENVYGVALIGKDGNIITQTENWDLMGDLPAINKLIQNNPELGQKGITSIEIQAVKYMVVENTEERKIATNITGKGHIIICPIPVGGSGGLICYINPQVGPRDALFNVQEFARKFETIL